MILSGSFLDYLYKKYPQIKNIVNLVDSNKLYKKVNINNATKEELVAVPYIGEYTAENIIKYRQQNGFFNEIDQVKEVKGIKDKNYEKFKHQIRIK